MKKILIALGLLSGIILLVIVGMHINNKNSTLREITLETPAVQEQKPSAASSASTTMNTTHSHITLVTNEGNIEIELFNDKTPNTVQNFLTLAGKDFYDNTKFHRVIDGFMIQGGDPLSKDDSKMMYWGTGGPGYTFADEIGPDNHNVRGTIAMANAGPNTNGSQFFINTVDNNFLDTKHTVFGKVVKGIEVVDAISKTPTGQNDRPIDPIIITDVQVAQ